MKFQRIVGRNGLVCILMVQLYFIPLYETLLSESDETMLFNELFQWFVDIM